MSGNQQPLAARNQNQTPNIPINLQPNVNVEPNVSVKVDGTGLDMFVPVISEIYREDVKELFKVKYLTKFEGGPTYDWMETAEKELGRNALAVKFSFGGGNLGCLGTVYKNTRIKAKPGHDWIMPLSQGGFSPPSQTGQPSRKTRKSSLNLSKAKRIARLS